MLYSCALMRALSPKLRVSVSTCPTGMQPMVVEIDRGVLGAGQRKRFVCESPNNTDSFSGFLFVFFLELLPVGDRLFRDRRFGPRQGRIDPELSIMRRLLFVGLEIKISASAGESVLQNGNYRSQIIVSELQTEPADKLHQIIFQTGPSVFKVRKAKSLERPGLINQNTDENGGEQSKCSNLFQRRMLERK